MSSIVRRALLAGGSLLAALALTATAVGADGWGQRVAGRHVYDTSGVLSAQQVADLEQAAAAVDRAGAPTVVYLRAKDADDAATRQDARNLMDAWSVESAAGARDGFVVLLNLRSGDSRHGSAALVAGAQHAAGRLGDARLQAIYDGTMKPYLARADLAGALSAVLGAVVEDLSAPAPTATPVAHGPSPGDVAGTLFGIGAVAALGIGFLVLLARGGYRGGGGPGGGGRRTGGRRTGWWAPVDGASAANAGSFTDGGGASSGSSSGGGSF